MNFEALIVEDSIACNGKRLTTFQLCYPRFVHAELMTHRVFSRNAMSSRAVPVAKMIAQVRNNPAVPCHWGSNKPGMQAGAELTGLDRYEAEKLWMMAAKEAASFAELMMKENLHKQVVNRILEPFQWMHTIVSATEWDNFWSLRCHEAAEPNFQKLAYMMQAAYVAGSPVRRAMREFDAESWHLPYVTALERQQYADDPYHLAKLSTARCARVSFLNHDGTTPIEAEDLKLFDRLVVAKPMHASPCEHQAWSDVRQTHRSGNFVGWSQHREFLERQNVARSQ